MKTAYHLVLAPKYNNSRNVLFMMKSDDFRFDTQEYQDKGPGTYDRRAKTFTVGKDVYDVFQDWSVKKR